MFSEFEQRIHEMAEAGQPLTADTMGAAYREIMKKYYGPVLRARRPGRQLLDSHSTLLLQLLRVQVRHELLRRLQHRQARVGR